MTDRAAILRSYTAMLLVALWAFQPLVTALHSREHAHRFCPEHQTFEETARGTGRLQTRRANSVPVLAALRADLGTDSVRPAHETCPLLTASPRGDAQAAETVTVVTDCLSTSLLATVPQGSLCSVPILATAPKASPPARA
jgi:hypothetical protein